MDGVAWLILKAAMAAGALCGLAGAAVEAFRVLRDVTEHFEGEVS